MAIRRTKRLVELEDCYGGGGLEIDRVKLKRLAKVLKTWLKTVDPNNDPHGFLTLDLPIVEAALNETLLLPFRGNEPRFDDWYYREGYKIEPREFKDIAYPFYNTIRGSNLVVNEDKDGYVTGITIIEKDGKRYAWAEFELPEDETP